MRHAYALFCYAYKSILQDQTPLLALRVALQNLPAFTSFSVLQLFRKVIFTTRYQIYIETRVFKN